MGVQICYVSKFPVQLIIAESRGFDVCVTSTANLNLGESRLDNLLYKNLFLRLSIIIIFFVLEDAGLRVAPDQQVVCCIALHATMLRTTTAGEDLH